MAVTRFFRKAEGKNSSEKLRGFINVTAESIKFHMLVFMVKELLTSSNLESVMYANNCKRKLY